VADVAPLPFSRVLQIEDPMHSDHYPNVPSDDDEAAPVDELAKHARDDADLFSTLGSWLRELLDEGRPS